MLRFQLLLRKELAQHAWALLGLMLLFGLVVLVEWADVVASPVATSRLEAAATSVRVFAPLAGLILGHRLVVREYYAKTQLFLEALPIRRWEMVLAKYVFGLCVLVAPSLLALGVIAALAQVELRDVSVMAARTTGYCCAVWSVLFALGLLGRLRFAAYAMLAIALYLLTSISDFDVTRFGPLALVDSTFAYEWRELPRRALLESSAFSAAFLALGLGLSLVREGSIAESLARRASPREKSGITVAIVAALSIASIVDAKQQRQPFEFTGSSVLRSSRTDLAIMYGFPELEPRASTAMNQLERSALGMQHELGMARPGPLRIAHNSRLGDNEIREQHLPDRDGVLLELNLGSSSAAPEDLLYNVAHGSINWISEGRAAFEPQHWLLDGFCSWWAVEQLPDAGERQWLRGLTAMRAVELAPATIDAWERVMEAAGEPLAAGLAFTALALIAERHGRRAVLELARPLLETNSKDLARRFEDVTKQTWPDFVRMWQSELRRRSRQGALADKLEQLRPTTATIRALRQSGIADLVYELRGEPRSCSLGHAVLQPYDEFIGDHGLARLPIEWDDGPAGVSGRLPGRYGTGQRVLAVIDCDVPLLRTKMRIAARRMTMP